MTDLIRQDQLGDITFGVPKNIALLNTPWGFYKFLGISKDASVEEIRAAYREMAHRLHPDKNTEVDKQAMRTLNMVADILLSKRDKIGGEHSPRNHYDTVSAFDEYFDGFIEHKGERTKKLSEIMLIRMQAEREQAIFENEMAQKVPEYAELKRKFENAGTVEGKKRVGEQLSKVVIKAKDLSDKEFEERKAAFQKVQEDFERDKREFAGEYQRNPDIFLARIADIFHIGGGEFIFGTYAFSTQIGLVAHETHDHILELVLAKDNYLVGFSQAHFKSLNARVRINDPNLTGIFHVIEGEVSVSYDAISYGEVIRARAPKVTVIEGFQNRGDLYVPNRFATPNWWRKKPALDIVVREGTIFLQLISQVRFTQRETHSPYSLEMLILDLNKKSPNYNNEKIRY
ncbi:MAG: DnaJ domain-containing protein [Candidatus Woesearchaeota archaeon]